MQKLHIRVNQLVRTRMYNSVLFEMRMKLTLTVAAIYASLLFPFELYKVHKPWLQRFAIFLLKHSHHFSQELGGISVAFSLVIFPAEWAINLIRVSLKENFNNVIRVTQKPRTSFDRLKK